MSTERELLEQAMRNAFGLGQKYWQQADSESYSQNAKSDVTRQKFEMLVAETLDAVFSKAALETPQA